MRVLIAKLVLFTLSCTTALSREYSRPKPNPLQKSALFQRPIQQPPPTTPSSTALEAVAVIEELEAWTGYEKEAKVVQKEGFLKKHPFISAVAITTCNAVAADLITQLMLEGSPWNPKRSLLFAAFGFLYQGCAQYALVNYGWERLFPGNSPRNVVSKICGMNLLSDPLLFMPTFYIFKEFMSSGNLAWGTIKAALLSYQANCLSDWRNSWMVWFPGHAVTYGVMPAHKRIPWMAFLSFFYMCVLSLTRG